MPKNARHSQKKCSVAWSLGTAQPHGRADDEAEHADRGENVVERVAAPRDRGEPNLHHLTRAEPQHRVVQPRAGVTLMEGMQHVGRLFDGLAIDREQQIALAYASPVGRRPVGASRTR